MHNWSDAHCGIHISFYSLSLTSLCLFKFFRYENSNMSEEQIADLVTDNLAAVGLKVYVCSSSYFLI